MRRRTLTRQQVLRRAAKHWLTENREAITSINLFIERHGLLASKLRFRSEPSSTPSKK
jgi:post-segregation antitoxin (ccd killing protein)